MSELQAALLSIGAGVVVVVYLFGWWKQRQYSRKFGTAFSQNHDDALYQGHAVSPNQKAQQQAEQSSGLAPLILEDTVVVNQEAVSEQPLAGERCAELSEPVAAVSAEEPAEGGEAVEVLPVATANAILNESCSLPDARSDFIIELHLAEASSAAALEGLWQRKFDFKKPVQVCGLTLSGGQWERVIADSQTLYTRFRIALQLVDRGGVISVAKLGDFRDLLSGIAAALHADTTIPDVQTTHLAAQSLDAFCAEVDRLVGINLIPPGDRQLNGRRISAAAALQGMKLESDGAFHLLNTQGNSLITLINQDAQPFQHHTLEYFSASGLTLLLDAPRVENPAQVFDLMLQIARALGRELQVNLVDDNNVLLAETGLDSIRTQIAEVEAKMRENDLVPGSAQALRLFS